jgi:RecA/RadA recombinase
MYYYNEAQYKQFQQTNTVSGVTDVVTPFIVFDLDNENDIELARKEAIELVSKLIAKGFTEDQITICFSGKKGFSVEIFTNTLFTPSEFKNLTKALSEGLTTRDEKIVNPSRVLRVPLTTHPDTGLFKLPITMAQLCEMPSDAIKAMAKDASNAAEWYMDEVLVPEAVLQLKDVTSTAAIHKPIEDLSELDYSQKPKDMPACKYSILNGFFKKGHRNDCLTALAAHFKARGFPKNITNGILVEAAGLQAQRHPEDSAVGEAEIWNTVIQSVYGPNWQGKTYSCKNHQWLKDLCPNNHYGCEHSYGKNKEVITIDAVSSIFKKYADEIEKNTIPTGIKEIDSQVRLQTKSHVVLAGSAGCGKTSILLNILKNASDRGQVALFGSLDMGDALVYQKLAQKVTGMDDKVLFNRYKSENNFRAEVDAMISKSYKNTLFDFSSGVTIDQLYERLYKAKMEYGSDLRLAVYDYINLISGPYSDANANLAYVAPKLKDLANELDLLVISLAQIGRDKGGPNTPLKSHRIAKGSSAIEESATVLFGAWREFYNTPNDNYISIAALKSRMGREFTEDLYWNGLTGEIRGLTGEEADKLAELRDNKEMESNDSLGKVKLMYKGGGF